MIPESKIYIQNQKTSFSLTDRSNKDNKDDNFVMAPAGYAIRLRWPWRADHQSGRSRISEAGWLRSGPKGSTEFRPYYVVSGGLKMPGKNFKWIRHKNKRIFCTNYSGLNEQEYCRTADEARLVLEQEPENSVLCVAIIDSGKITEGIRQKAREQREATRKHLKALAAVGMKGPAKILAQLIYRDVYFAKNINEAMDWLVEK
jgi:ABC-type dipeptide/oligopeptide/nickel transport system ATPase component